MTAQDGYEFAAFTWFQGTKENPGITPPLDYQAGYIVGRSEGLIAGTSAGSASGTARGRALGYKQGYEDGLIAGRRSGFATGRASVAVVVDEPDETEPTVTPVTTEGELDPDFEVAAITPIVIDIEDDTEVAYVGVFATLPGSTDKIAVYRRGAFEPPFDVYSYTSEPSAGVTRLHIRHNTGWSPGSVTLSTDIVDTAGNIDV